MDKHIFKTKIFASFLRYLLPDIVYLFCLFVFFFFLFLIIGLNIIYPLSIIFIVIFPITLFMNMISFIRLNKTKFVIIQGQMIEIQKNKGSKVQLDISNSITYTAIIPPRTEGFILKDVSKKVIIWKHEFPRSNWKIIKNFINSYSPPKEIIKDYLLRSFHKY